MHEILKNKLKKSQSVSCAAQKNLIRVINFKISKNVYMKTPQHIHQGVNRLMGISASLLTGK